MILSLRDLLRIPHLATVNLPAAKSFSGACTDTRSLRSNEIYFAIRGEHLDGHNFVGAAFDRGAGCAVIDSHANPTQWRSYPLVIVENTTRAYGNLANIWRNKYDIPVIAVAGSNGKTTTKEMISAVLGKRYCVLSTEGNLNNHIGVPQSLLRLNAKHEIAVIEVGTNHFGELEHLCEILEPTHGLITNVGREHLEFFGNLSGVEAAEGELFTSLAQSGTAFVNTDDAHVLRQARIVRRTVTYGFSKRSNQVRGQFLRARKNGCVDFSVHTGTGSEFVVRLSVPGRHAMMNALAAASVGLSFEVRTRDIQTSLSRFVPIGKRMEALEVASVRILNDTYNANPDSVISALSTLKSMKSEGKKIVVLGDMLELGRSSIRQHIILGKTMGKMRLEYLLTIGEMARHLCNAVRVKAKVHFEKKQHLAEYLADILSPGDIVLVKGSRGMKMEDIVTYIVNRLRKKAA